MEFDSNYFRRLLMEAPEDEQPPDMPDEGGGDPPDMPEDNFDAPPDTGGGEPPPDLDDSGGMDDFGDDTTGQDEGEENPAQNLEFDEKISAIMNQQLYQRFLELIGNLTTQISQMKDNTDVLYAISPDIAYIVDILNDLEENIRLYLKNYFVHENYGKNRFFFDKCLNLIALVNEEFDKYVKKGLKHVDV